MITCLVSGCVFGAAYPLGQVLLRDEEIPIDVRLRAFNPLIPAEIGPSSLPVAIRGMN
jgi:uncharacterized protein (DUF608 family)